MEFDIGQYFLGHGNIRAFVKLMHYPYLIDAAFDVKTGQFRPGPLRIVLRRYTRILMEHYGADAGKKIASSLSIATDSDESPNGFFGFDGLERLCFSSEPNEKRRIIIGMQRAYLSLARFGNCLGLSPEDRTGQEHGHAESILQEILREPDSFLFIRPFVRRYSFSVSPKLTSFDGNRVLNIAHEIDVTRRYLPDIHWRSVTVPLSVDLAGDFEKGDEDAGVVVGTYGDVEIRCRIVCKDGPNDHNWRRGFLRRLQGPVMFFEHSAYSPEVEYFVRVTFPSQSPDECNMDYYGEQNLMSSVARMLYAGLYQRLFQSVVDEGNPQLIRFRGGKEVSVQT